MCGRRLLILGTDNRSLCRRINTKCSPYRSSFVASLGSAIASTPLDVIRTRLMNQKRMLVTSMNGCASAAPAAKLYDGTMHCALETVRREGVMALYKGFIPAWLRMGPWNIIFFITYEQLKVLY